MTSFVIIIIFVNFQLKQLSAKFLPLIISYSCSIPISSLVRPPKKASRSLSLFWTWSDFCIWFLLWHSLHNFGKSLTRGKWYEVVQVEPQETETFLGVKSSELHHSFQQSNKLCISRIKYLLKVSIQRFKFWTPRYKYYRFINKDKYRNVSSKGLPLNQNND